LAFGSRPGLIMEASQAAIMDTLSFEELLWGISIKYESLRLENLELTGTGDVQKTSLSTPRSCPGSSASKLLVSIPKRVDKPAGFVESQNYSWELPSIPPSPIWSERSEANVTITKEGCRLAMSPCLRQKVPPPDTDFESLDDFDSVRYNGWPTAKRSNHECVQSMAAPTMSRKFSVAPTMRSAFSDAMPLRYQKQFNRLDLDGSGLLSAPRCLELMHQLQKLGLSQHPLPDAEELAVAIRRFTSDEPSDPCLLLPVDRESATKIGFSSYDFVCLMKQEKRASMMFADHHQQTLINNLCDAFRKESLHHQGERIHHILSEKPEEGPQEDQKKNILDVVSATVIFMNALMIGISTDVYENADFWWFIEIGFTVFFTTELLFNMRTSGIRLFFLGKAWAWNSFDALVVAIAIFDLGFTAIYRAIGPSGPGGPDTGSFTIIKMARLGRLARLIRVLRFKIFNELKSMVQGVLAGLRVLFWAIVLLFFFIYLLGVVMRKTVGDAEHPDHEYSRHKSFETVPISMFTLFRCFTDGCTSYDGTPLQSHLYEYYGFAFMFGYMLVYMFVTIGIFNLIMAIFIDNVMDASMQRKKEELGASAVRLECKLKELIEQLANRKKSVQQRPWGTMINGIGDKVADAVLTEEAKRRALFHRAESVDESMRVLAEEDLVISKTLFMAWVSEPDMVNMLSELDIAVANKADLFDVLDCDLSGELEVPELIDGLMKLRGPADKSDAVAAFLGVRHLTKMAVEISDSLAGIRELVRVVVNCKGGAPN